MSNFGTDYPFDNWKDFFNAFKVAFEIEFLPYRLPEYNAFLTKNPEGAVDIINSLIKAGCDPNEGLELLIETALDDAFNSIMLIDFIEDLIDLFYDNGASYSNIEYLFDLPAYDEIDEEDQFELKAQDYDVRGAILDCLSLNGVNVRGDIDWESIDPIYFDGEIIPEYSHLSFRMRCAMALKYHSEALKKPNPEPDGER